MNYTVLPANLDRMTAGMNYTVLPANLDRMTDSGDKLYSVASKFGQND